MTSSMLPRDRCDYSAIVDRLPLKLPAMRGSCSDYRQLRGLGHRPADASPGAAGTDRRAAASA
jgi:hypothetical protein